jgi:hypothetical protein
MSLRRNYGRRRKPSTPKHVRDAANTLASLGPDFCGRYGFDADGKPQYYYLGRLWTGSSNRLGCGS